MTNKLIDWATVPVGVMTSYGWLIFHNHDSVTTLAKITNPAKTITVPSVLCTSEHRVRLAPADQQPWLVYEEGVTVIPEWAEVTYLVAKGSYHEDVELFKEDEYPRRVNNPVVQYKLGDTEGKLFKDGWTDNPEDFKNEAN